MTSIIMDEKRLYVMDGVIFTVLTLAVHFNRNYSGIIYSMLIITLEIKETGNLEKLTPGQKI